MNPLFLAPTTLPDTLPVEYILAAKQGGCDGVGLRLNRSPGLPFHPVVGDAALIRNMQCVLADTGLPVLDIYSFYLRPDTNIDDFIPALALGAEFGAKFAVVMGDDTDGSRLSNNFGRICDEAARFGLTCTVEFAVIRPLATLQQTLKLIRESGRKNAVVCMDPLNFFRAGESARDLKGLDPALFPYAQVSDGIRSPDDDLANLGRMGPNQRRMLGEGEVPMAELLDSLPRGLPLSIELPMPRGGTHSANEWATLVVRNVRGFLAQYYANAK